MEVGDRVAKLLLGSDTKPTSAHVILPNINAALGSWGRS